MPQIEVTFDIDANGILNVKAVDKATSKAQHITITASSGLSKDEVEKMKKEAEQHATEDKKKRELIDMKNQADSVVYQTEKMIKEQGEKVPADVKKIVEEKLEEVKKVKDGEDAEAIKKSMDDLQQAAMKIGEAMYKQGQQTTPNTQQSTAGQTSGDNKSSPVEGEVEDVKK